MCSIAINNDLLQWLGSPHTSKHILSRNTFTVRTGSHYFFVWFWFDNNPFTYNL